MIGNPLHADYAHTNKYKDKTIPVCVEAGAEPNGNLYESKSGTTPLVIL